MLKGSFATCVQSPPLPPPPTPPPPPPHTHTQLVSSILLMVTHRPPHPLHRISFPHSPPSSPHSSPSLPPFRQAQRARGSLHGVMELNAPFKSTLTLVWSPPLAQLLRQLAVNNSSNDRTAKSRANTRAVQSQKTPNSFIHKTRRQTAATR